MSLHNSSKDNLIEGDSNIVSLKKSTKYIKIFNSKEERLFNISFQHHTSPNNVTFAATSMNFNSNNNISIISFDENLESDSNEDNDNETNIFNNFEKIDEIKNKSYDDGIKQERQNEPTINDNISSKSFEECHSKPYIKSPQKNINFSPPKPSFSPTLIDKIDSKFPVSSLKFSPIKSSKNLFITTSDKLYLHSFDKGIIHQIAAYTPNVSEKVFAPFTSAAWSSANDGSIVGVGSLDGRCLLFDLNAQNLSSIVMACDREIYDISFGPTEKIILTACGNGEVRYFDMKSDDFTIINRTEEPLCPILRASLKTGDPELALVVGLHKNEIEIYDIRYPGSLLARLEGHHNVVNAAIWSPFGHSTVVSVGDDKKAFIWEIINSSSGNNNENNINNSKDANDSNILSGSNFDAPGNVETFPYSAEAMCIMGYESCQEFENVDWSETGNWIGATRGASVEILKVK